MNNTQNVTICLLAITAAVLGAILWTTNSDNAAYAGMTSEKGGDYILGAGAWSKSTDLIYTIDIAARQLNVYYANPNANGGAGSVDVIQQMDLEKAFRD